MLILRGFHRLSSESLVFFWLLKNSLHIPCNTSKRPVKRPALGFLKYIFYFTGFSCEAYSFIFYILHSPPSVSKARQKLVIYQTMQWIFFIAQKQTSIFLKSWKLLILGRLSFHLMLVTLSLLQNSSFGTWNALPLLVLVSGAQRPLLG